MTIRIKVSADHQGWSDDRYWIGFLVHHHYLSADRALRPKTSALEITSLALRLSKPQQGGFSFPLDLLNENRASERCITYYLLEIKDLNRAFTKRQYRAIDEIEFLIFEKTGRSFAESRIRGEVEFITDERTYCARVTHSIWANWALRTTFACAHDSTLVPNLSDTWEPVSNWPDNIRSDLQAYLLHADKLKEQHPRPLPEDSGHARPMEGQLPAQTQTEDPRETTESEPQGPAATPVESPKQEKPALVGGASSSPTKRLGAGPAVVIVVFFAIVGWVLLFAPPSHHPPPKEPKSEVRGTLQANAADSFSPGTLATRITLLESALGHTEAGNTSAADRALRDLTAYTKPERGNQPRARQLNNEASVMLKAGQYRKASVKLGDALAADRSDEEIVHNLAIALLHLGQLGDARAVLTDALTLSPKYAQAWMTLGRVYAQNQQGSKAVSAFVLAHRLSAAQGDIVASLSKTSLESQEANPVARESARKALQIIAATKKASAPTKEESSGTTPAVPPESKQKSAEVKDAPGKGPAQVAADSQAEADEPSQARKDFLRKRALATAPASSVPAPTTDGKGVALLEQAQASLARKDYRRARFLAESILAMDPANGYANMVRQRALEGQERAEREEREERALRGITIK